MMLPTAVGEAFFCRFLFLQHNIRHANMHGRILMISSNYVQSSTRDVFFLFSFNGSFVRELTRFFVVNQCGCLIGVNDVNFVNILDMI